MEHNRFRLNLQSLERPKNTREILKNAFAKINCLECGICCSDSPRHVTLISRGDPNSAVLLEAAKNRFPEKVELSPLEGHRLVGNDCCAFLEEKGNEKPCSVYNIRPVICAVFPFMLQSMRTKPQEGPITEKSFIVLTSKCPPLAEARQHEIFYLTEKDIIGKKQNFRYRLPLLKKSYKILRAYTKANIGFSEDHLLRVRNSVIFPLG